MLAYFVLEEVNKRDFCAFWSQWKVVFARVQQVDLIALQSCVFKSRDSSVTHQNLCSLICANRVTGVTSYLIQAWIELDMLLIPVLQGREITTWSVESTWKVYQSVEEQLLLFMLS